MTNAASPYLLDQPPTSTGRVFLPRAFWHWCALHHGLSPEEIADAFSPTPRMAADASQVSLASRLVGECIARGQIDTWVRPIGGGAPVRLPAGMWELDDFRGRFATGAIDPKRPFEPDAPPTHWIFLDVDHFNAVVEASMPEVGCRHQRATSDPATPTADAAAGSEFHEARERADRFLRLPEVKQRTGLSRSTIYRRIGEGRFPAGIDLGGNVAAWRESDVDEWMREPG